MLKCIPLWFLALALLGCGDDNAIKDSTDDGIVPTSPSSQPSNHNAPNDGEAEPSTPSPGQEIVIPEVEIPDIRWSLIAYTASGNRVDIEPTDPDPTWISNSFTVTSLLSPTNTLEARINCLSYQHEIEITSPTTFRIGLGESFVADPDCIPNVPEGVVEGVLREFANITAEADESGELYVTDGSEVVLILTAIFLDIE